MRYALLLTIVAALSAGCETVGTTVMQLRHGDHMKSLEEAPTDVAWAELDRDPGMADHLAGSLGYPDMTEMRARLAEDAEDMMRSSDLGVQHHNGTMDTVSRFFVERIASAVPAQDQSSPYVLVITDFEINPENPSLEFATRNFRSALLESPEIGRRFVIHAVSQSDANRVLEQFESDVADRINPINGTNDQLARAFNTDSYFVVEPSILQEYDHHGRMIRVWTHIDVYRPRQRTATLSEQFSSSYYFHPLRDRGVWLSESENGELRRNWESRTGRKGKDADADV